MLDRVLNGPQGGLNLEKLCIIPGQQCWIVYIDAIVSSHGLHIIINILTLNIFQFTLGFRLCWKYTRYNIYDYTSCSL